MTTTQFLVFLARKVAQLALAIGYEETAHQIADAVVSYQEKVEV